MTDTITEVDTGRPRDAVLTMYYTVEELAVIASLLDLDCLPGVREVELTPATRSLATRTLLARNILKVEGEEVTIRAPHAQFFVSMVDSAATTQVDMTTTKGPWRTTLFGIDDGCVLVEEPDGEGIAVVALHPGSCRAVVDDSLGLTDPQGAALRPELISIDLVEFRRSGEATEVTHERYERSGGAWAKVATAG